MNYRVLPRRESYIPCPVCRGKRLCQDPACVNVGKPCPYCRGAGFYWYHPRVTRTRMRKLSQWRREHPHLQ